MEKAVDIKLQTGISCCNNACCTTLHIFDPFKRPPPDFSLHFSISFFGSSINKYFPEANVQSLGSLLFNIVPHDSGQDFTLRKTQELFSRLPWTHIFWINFSWKLECLKQHFYVSTTIIPLVLFVNHQDNLSLSQFAGFSLSGSIFTLFFIPCLMGPTYL